MNVLIADKLSPEVVKSLEALGLQVEVRDYLDADSLPGALKFADILVVRSTKVTATAIKAGSVLSLIIRAGAGVDTIDLAAAARKASTWPTAPARTPRPWPSWRSASWWRPTAASPTPPRPCAAAHGGRRNSARPAGWPAAPWASSVTGPSAGRWPSGPWEWR